MQKLNINDLVEFNDQKFNPVVLANEPEVRLVLLCLRAGQRVPEHSAAGTITVQAVSGRATFYAGEGEAEMFPGTLVRLGAGRPHRVEAHADTALLVTMVKTPQAARPGEAGAAGRELDLRGTPRPERHPLVFAAFDGLGVGESFVVVNDHDPRPLREQIKRAREGEVRWEYVERGPETFRVRVTRVAPPSGGRGADGAGSPDQPVGIG